MKVKNITAINGRVCGCGKWFEHWEHHSGRELPAYCAEQTCASRPEVGVYAQKHQSADESWYLILLCERHGNGAEKTLRVRDATLMVSVGGCGSGG